MFYTFHSSKADRDTASGNKRRKVSRACDHCRLHRVRCSGRVPCLECVEKDIPCLFSSNYSHRSDRHRAADGPGETRRIGRGLESPLSTRSDDGTQVAPQCIDSMLGFTSRINDFFSAVLVHSSPPLWENASPPKFSTPYLQVCREAEISCESQLSGSQFNSLLSIYWRRYHALAPVFSRQDFERQLELQSTSGSVSQRDMLLINSVMALCCHYTFYSSLSSQLLGLQGNRPSIAQHYFDLCSESIGCAITFGQPALLHVQACIMMALYLLAAGQLHAAYNITGLGIRVAHILNLHQEPTENMKPDDKELSRRIWWTLVHLDFKSSKRLGKPLGIQLDKTTCTLPGNQSYRPSYNSSKDGSFSYHDQSVLLTSLSLHVDQAISKRCISQRENSLAELGEQAQVLTEELHPLHNWRENMSTSSTFVKLLLNVDYTPALIIESSEYETTERRSTEVQQGTLLELQYHDIMNELHRRFIRFARHFSHPEPNILVDSHANTALRHAMMTIDIVHCRIMHHEILRGCSELLQWQWNATLTLLGFMLAYPLCFLAPEADKRLVMAIEVYEATASRPFAARAAGIARNMREKVHGLVALLKKKVDLNGEDICQLSSNNDVIGDDISVAITREQFQTDMPEAVEDDLWSWVEGVDANAWSRYHDEVTATLADFEEPLRNSHLFTM